jgi:hypothetical protein
MVARMPKTRKKQPPQPKVGIFWAVSGKLITIGIPAVEGVRYGDYLIYEPSHHDTWTELQASGVVPHDCEYEEYPRGRVMLHRHDETFLLLADKCILNDKHLLGQVMEEMYLPRNLTVMNTDSHYRCFRCLGIDGQLEDADASDE